MLNGEVPLQNFPILTCKVKENYMGEKNQVFTFVLTANHFF
jgi:hypothetical protein